MYEIFVTRSARKGAKKLPEAVRVAAYEAANTLKTSPHAQGEKLLGSLHFLRSLHFKIGGKDYRIAYEINEKRKAIVIHLVQTREGFYEKLKRLFR